MHQRHTRLKAVENLVDDFDEMEFADMIGQCQLFTAVDVAVRGCAGWKGSNLRHVYVRPGSERIGIGTRSW